MASGKKLSRFRLTTPSRVNDSRILSCSESKAAIRSAVSVRRGRSTVSRIARMRAESFVEIPCAASESALAEFRAQLLGWLRGVEVLETNGCDVAAESLQEQGHRPRPRLFNHSGSGAGEIRCHVALRHASVRMAGKVVDQCQRLAFCCVDAQQADLRIDRSQGHHVSIGWRWAWHGGLSNACRPSCGAGDSS